MAPFRECAAVRFWIGLFVERCVGWFTGKTDGMCLERKKKKKKKVQKEEGLDQCPGRHHNRTARTQQTRIHRQQDGHTVSVF